MTSISQPLAEGQRFDTPEVRPASHGLSVLIFRRPVMPPTEVLEAASDDDDKAWSEGAHAEGFSPGAIEAARLRFADQNPSRQQLVAYLTWEREQANACA